MILTDEMKQVISAKKMNGIMMTYLFLSIVCTIKGLTAYFSGRFPILFVFGVLLFVSMCYPRIRFVLDVRHDNVTITKATVVDKYKLRTGRKRSFVVLKTETGEECKLHALPRIYQETDIGEEGIYVKSKHLRTFYFMREFHK